MLDGILWMVVTSLTWLISAEVLAYASTLIDFPLHWTLQALILALPTLLGYLLYKMLNHLEVGRYTLLFIYITNICLLMCLHPQYKDSTYNFFDNLFKEEETNKLNFMQKRAEEK